MGQNVEVARRKYQEVDAEYQRALKLFKDAHNDLMSARSGEEKAAAKARMDAADPEYSRLSKEVMKAKHDLQVAEALSQRSLADMEDELRELQLLYKGNERDFISAKKALQKAEASGDVQLIKEATEEFQTIRGIGNQISFDMGNLASLIRETKKRINF